MQKAVAIAVNVFNFLLLPELIVTTMQKTREKNTCKYNSFVHNVRNSKICYYTNDTCKQYAVKLSYVERNEIVGNSEETRCIYYSKIMENRVDVFHIYSKYTRSIQ